MLVRRVDGRLRGKDMKILVTRVYSFEALLKRLDMEFWRVREHNEMNYTFIPIQYWGGD